MRGRAVILAAALAWFVPIGSAEAKLDILVDKVTQRMLVIQDGYIRYMWPVSTGRDSMATPNGVYAPQRLERNWFSTAYYNSPMPFSIFFHNGYAIHGSYAIDRLGGPASHGCVRLHPHHAAILFDLVQQEGPGNTKIEITEDGRPEQRPLPGREIAGPPFREMAGPPSREMAGPPSREMAGPPSREMVGPPSREMAGPPSREMVGPPSREMVGPPSREFIERPPREIAGLPPREIAGAPRREIATGPGDIPADPRVIRYREGMDMPDPLGAQRGNPQIAAKTGLPPPRAASPARRLLAYVKPSASVARAPGGAAMADTANGSPKPSNEVSDSRSRPKIEAPRVIDAPRVAEGSSGEPTQRASSASSLKLLPASCWSGGASRWKWWAGPGNACK